MAEDRPEAGGPGARSRSVGRALLKVLAWAGGTILALLALVSLGLAVLDTRPGHAIDAWLIARLPLAGGAHIRVKTIEGSIWGRVVFDDLEVRDAKGVFLTTPRLVLDWSPWDLLHKTIEVHELSADTVRLLRRPVLKPSPPRTKSAGLPNIDLSRLHIGTLWLEPALTGDRRRLGVDGDLTLIKGHAKADLHVQAQAVANQGSGDRLAVRLDAEPSLDRLILDAHLTAPKDGVVDRLTGLGRPLTMDLSGRGSWAAWDGSAAAAVGGQPLLRALVTARDGRFSIKGAAHPALVASDAAALTEPRLGFGLVFSLAGRRVTGAVALRSAALQVLAYGGLDLQHGAFRDVKLSGRLADPHALASNLSGRDLRMEATLDGAFRHAAATYHVQAASLGLGGRRIERLDATGGAAPDIANGWTARFQASASGIEGAGVSVAALSRRLKAEGTLRLTPTHVSGQGLQIVSDHLRARIDLDLAFDTGKYGGKVEAKARTVPVKGLGLIDVSANLTVASTGKARITATGRLHGRTVRLDNPTAAKLLGGRAVIDARLERTANGGISLAGLTITAPKLHLANGRATYGPGGRIAASLAAVSTDYGPITLRASGTVAAPRAVIHADNLGVAGLKDVDLKLSGRGGGDYDVTVRGASRYGPVSADLGLTLRGGGLSARVDSAEFAGVRLSGAVRRTAAGPFAGTLAVSGRGLSGTVTLSAAGAAQAADLALRARNASLPLDPPVTIASGLVRAKLTLRPGAPDVSGTATLSGVRRGGLLVSRASLALAYADGSGRASATLAAERGAPFTLALSARLSPDQIVVDGSGSVDRIPVRLAQPAVVRRTAAGYRLEPAVLTSRTSRVEVSGSYGGGAAAANIRIDQLELGLARAVAPGLGLAGRASGTIDLSLPKAGAVPVAHVRLQLARFTRSTAAAVSDPIDVTLAADLDGSGLDAHALLKRPGGAVVGRAQARVALAPGGSGPWMRRLRAAPLTGGVRFNGDAQILWSLSGLANQTVSGPIAIGADVAGSLDAPRLTGVVRAKSLRYENVEFGAVVDAIAVDARFTGTRLQIDSLTGRAGDGSISASGYADLSAADGFPVDLQVRFDKARLANGEDLGATVSGRLSLVNSKAGGALVSGDLTLDQGRYQIVRRGKDEIVELTGVHRAGQPLREVKPSQVQTTAAGFLGKWRLNVQVHAPQQLYVRGLGLDSEWRADLTITGALDQPRVVGDVTLLRGDFSFAGRDLTLSRGLIHLDGAEPPNPTLDMEATATVEDVTARIDIAGTARDPQISFSSTPSLPQDEVLSRLLFGSSVGQLSAVQAVQLAASLNALRGGGAGFDPIGKLRQVTGLDQLKFYAADQASGRGAAVGVGRHIAKNLYVELTTDAQGYTATQIELALTKTLSLLSQVGTFGGTKVELRYSHRY